MPDTASSNANALKTLLYAPMRAIVVPLEQVPDPVFAQQTMGPGLALEPLEQMLVAPCDGEIIHLARTHHALTLKTDAGCELLIHLGLDTVDLEGEGIEVQVASGTRVLAGDTLWHFDADLLARRALSLITPMVITNAEHWHCELSCAPGQLVDRLTPLMTLIPISMSLDEAQQPVNERHAQVTLALAAGLHARPAARLRNIARTHSCSMTLTHDKARADATSLTALMGLSLQQGDNILVSVRGDSAAKALAEVVTLLSTPESKRADPSSGSMAKAKTHTVMSGESAGSAYCPGLVASPGLAIGPLSRLQRKRIEVNADREGSVEEEEQRFRAAVESLDQALAASVNSARRQGHSEEADILEAHQAWLDDPSLYEQTVAQIRDGRTAEFAWRDVLEAQIVQLKASRNVLLAARADDLRDLQERLLAQLNPQALAAGAPDMAPGAIVVAEEMTPSQLIALDAVSPAGLCLVGGGTTSHVALLARARGLPCLAAMGSRLLEVATIHEGQQVILDARSGRLETDPVPSRVTEVRERIDEAHAQAVADREAAHQHARTLNGVLIEVCANVAGHDEAAQAHGLGADGIGLLRSEFIFMESPQAPGVEEQRLVYQQALDAMGDRPVIIRTLDIGADKQLDYLPLPAVPNPALGTRGVRLMARHGALLDDQLRALLSVRPLSRLKIMVPMVTDATELAAVRKRLDVLAREIGLEERPALGAMIEVPAAALCADALAKEADFLSIGTNDLVQYTLAMDREDPDLAARADVLHPAVLRLIDMTVKGAAGQQCRVGVCGAAAGDPQAWAALVALGVDELSVEPARIATIKAGIRRLDHDALASRLRAWLAEGMDAIPLRRHLVDWLETPQQSTTITAESDDAI